MRLKARLVLVGTLITGPVEKGLMKTTVEISDVLLRDVRKLAAREGVIPRTLVERGLPSRPRRDEWRRAVQAAAARFRGQRRTAALARALDQADAWLQLTTLTL